MRRVFKQISCVFALGGLVGVASAQTYPVKPIRVVIGLPPGTQVDAVARMVGAEMEKRLGQPFVLDFKPGANSTIGAHFVATAAPDGYTLYYGVTTTPHPLFNKSNGVDAARDFAPVSWFTAAPFVLVSRTSLPASSMPELLAYGKANPSKLTYGSPTPIIDLGMAVLGNKTGLAARDIPYNATAPIVVAMSAGDVDLTIGTAQSISAGVQSGKLRVLFTMSSKRLGMLPNVPTSAEAGIPGYELGSSAGLWAPRGTPKDITQKLSSEAALALKIPAVNDQLRNTFGFEPMGSTPEEQLRHQEAEIQFFTEAARLANYQPQ